MATPHVLLVEDSCVDRLVASRLLKSFNIRGEMTNMNSHLHSTINLLDVLFCKYLVLSFIPIPKWTIMVCTSDFPCHIDALMFLCSVVVCNCFNQIHLELQWILILAIFKIYKVDLFSYL